MNETCRNLQSPKAVQSVVRHRTGNNVASHDDPVDVSYVDLPKDSLEGGKIAVNIVNGGNDFALLRHVKRVTRLNRYNGKSEYSYTEMPSRADSLISSAAKRRDA